MLKVAINFSSGSTVVEPSTHNPKVVGSNPSPLPLGERNCKNVNYAECHYTDCCGAK